MYNKSFKDLNIGDNFTTATGNWIVYDKGIKTLLAAKLPLNDRLDIHEQLDIFFIYDFPLL